MSKLVVGVIGSGFIASRVHIPLLSCIHEVRLGYVADIKDTSALAGAYGIKSVRIERTLSNLPACDIALLAIPVGVREQYIEEFSHRGAAIFSEKPFAVNLATHERFLEASHKITCNFMSTCYSSTNQLKSIIMSGVLGRVNKIIVSEGGITGPTGKVSDHYQGKREMAGGGILMERGCQTLAQLLYVLEDCEITLKDSEIVWQDDLDIDVSALLRVSGKQDFDLSFQLSVIKPLGHRTRVLFDNAELVFNHYEPSSTLTLEDKGGLMGPRGKLGIKPDNHWATSYTQAYYLKWVKFLEQIRNTEPMDTKLETSYHTTRLISDIYKHAGKTST